MSSSVFMSPSVFEWNWTGKQDSTEGIAVFKTADVVVAVELPTFKLASQIAALLTDVEYKARGQMCDKIANACRDAIQEVRP
jgi:hypothetical protein